MFKYLSDYDISHSIPTITQLIHNKTYQSVVSSILPSKTPGKKKHRPVFFSPSLSHHTTSHHTISTNAKQRRRAAASTAVLRGVPPSHIAGANHLRPASNTTPRATRKSRGRAPSSTKREADGRRASARRKGGWPEAQQTFLPRAIIAPFCVAYPVDQSWAGCPAFCFFCGAGQAALRRRWPRR